MVEKQLADYIAIVRRFSTRSYCITKRAIGFDPVRVNVSSVTVHGEEKLSIHRHAGGIPLEGRAGNRGKLPIGCRGISSYLIYAAARDSARHIYIGNRGVICRSMETIFNWCGCSLGECLGGQG